MTAIVCIVLALWLLASIANNVNVSWIVEWMSPLRSFSFLPGLSFFAPEPIDVDYHLVVRDFDGAGGATEWRELVIDHHGSFRALWSTAKRDHQAMLEVMSGLANIQTFVAPAVPDPTALILVSFPYLFLLRAALQVPRAPGAVKRQFMVVETKGFGYGRKLQLGILSNAHRFE